MPSTINFYLSSTMIRLFTPLLVIFCSFNLHASPPKSNANSIGVIWHKLSIHSQNTGHKIHMLGVDNGEGSAKGFKKNIAAIDSLLDQLVSKGVLKKQQFILKPQLDLEESLIVAVAKLIEKAAPQYGYYVVREMMDVGARQLLKEFDEDAPVILNVRMPEKLLEEFAALLNKSGFKK